MHSAPTPQPAASTLSPGVSGLPQLHAGASAPRASETANVTSATEEESWRMPADRRPMAYCHAMRKANAVDGTALLHWIELSLPEPPWNELEPFVGFVFL